MKYLGSIEAQPDPPGVDFERWVRLIDEHPNLRHVEPRVGVNPFTREPHAYRAHPGTAYLMCEETEIGMLDWAHDGTNRIAVDGEGCRAVEIASEIARHLAASFIPDSE